MGSTMPDSCPMCDSAEIATHFDRDTTGPDWAADCNDCHHHWDADSGQLDERRTRSAPLSSPAHEEQGMAMMADDLVTESGSERAGSVTEQSVDSDTTS
jgi:hypothetical protein